MESIIQSAIYSPVPGLKDVWCASNIDVPYKNLSSLEKATYLVRQSFFIKYCKMLHGENLPPIIEDYANNIQQLLEWDCAMMHKYNRPNTEENLRAKIGLSIAKSFLSKTDDYDVDNNLALTYFEHGNPLVADPTPKVGSMPFIKTCLNYWDNIAKLEKHNDNYTVVPIVDVCIPKIDVICTTLSITDAVSDKFIRYEFNAELVNKLRTASPNMYNDANSLLCFMSCFNWSDKKVSDLFAVFAKNAMTLDVCNERCKHDVFGKYEYRNLWNAGAYYAIIKNVMPNTLDTNKFASCKCPEVIVSFLTLVSVLRNKYGLEIDNQELINTMTEYSEEFVDILKNKDTNMSAYDKYSNSILPSIIASSEAANEEVKEETPAKEEEEAPAEEPTEEAPEETTEEPVEGETTEEPVEGETTEEPADEPEPPEEIKSSKKGDKSSKVDIELEAEVTLDIVLLRDEISAFIDNTVTHPPKGVSSTDLEVLLKLQQEWLNIFSVQTSLNIINKIVQCPIVIK